MRLGLSFILLAVLSAIFFSNSPEDTIDLYAINSPFANSQYTKENIDPVAVNTTSLFFDGATLINPVDGATNVPVNTTIEWTPVPGIIGYFITLGTTPGGNDLADMQATGSATSYTPPLGLPENTTIYVRITLFIPNADNITCQEESFTTEDVTVPPPCTVLTNPLNGSISVSTDTNISWTFAPSATSYRISIGTTPGGTDIINDINVGNTLTFNPPVDFPNDTQIYVLVTPVNENGDAVGCIEESFTTGTIIIRPNCTSLISPMNGAINVPLSIPLMWNPVPGAIGYRVSIGLTPGGTEILNNAVFTGTAAPVLNFEPNTILFVTITPFNAAGDALNCTGESFATSMGCNFIDPITGEMVNLIPELEFPDAFFLCLDDLPLNINAPAGFDGYRWIRLNSNNTETLLSDTVNVAIDESGDYRLEVFNNFDQFGTIVACENSQNFTVSTSEIATIIGIEVDDITQNNSITVLVEGSGDYEYSLNNIDGPYQSSNLFTNVSAGFSTVYVRDRNGCGIAQEVVAVVGFPNFFTPNNDGFNDRWQIFSDNQPLLQNATIFIFNRFGKLLKQMTTESEGWDGTFNGSPLPSSDYWFRINLLDGREFTGHFSLKR